MTAPPTCTTTEEPISHYEFAWSDIIRPGPQVSEHTTAKAVLFFLHSKSYKLFSGHLCCSDDDGKEHDGCLTFVKELNAAAGQETINVTHYSWTLTNA